MKLTWTGERPLEKVNLLLPVSLRQKVGLPLDYVEAVCAHNAAIPTPGAFTAGGRPYVWERLISANPEDSFNLQSAAEAFPEGSHVFPFGSDAFGNLLCLCGEFTPAVRLSLHEEDVFVAVADSFAQFLAMLA